MVLLPAFATGIAAWFIPGSLFGSDSTDAFIFGALPIIAFYLWTYKNAKREDKRPIGALLAIYAVVIMFWAVFKQNGTALTTWAEFYTDREMPASVQGFAEEIKMAQVIKSDSALFTQYDAQFRTTRDASNKIVKVKSLDPYYKNVAPDKIPPPGGSTSLFSTELFQSINPFFVVVLTPLVIAFFARLRRRGKEPSTPAKIGWGLVISALSTLITVAAVYACHNGLEKSSSWWLIGTYAVVTVGELCLSPMGLSMVSKMAPRHLTGLMMGGWQLATALGNKLSGVLASMWDKYDDKANFFWVNFVLLCIASLILFVMLKRLRGIFIEKGIT